MHIVSRNLRQEMALVERALKVRPYPDEAAAAFASPGASAVFELRPMPLNASRFNFGSSTGCIPYAAVNNPPFERAVERHADREQEGIPWHVTARLPRLKRRLPFWERRVLESCCEQGRSIRQVAEAWGTSKSALARLKDKALERLARELWDDGGQPVYERAA